MNRTKLSQAIQMVLVTQAAVSTLVGMPEASAQHVAPADQRPAAHYQMQNSQVIGQPQQIATGYPANAAVVQQSAPAGQGALSNMAYPQSLAQPQFVYQYAQPQNLTPEQAAVLQSSYDSVLARTQVPTVQYYAQGHPVQVNAQGQPIQMLPQHQQVQLNAQGQPVRIYPQSHPVQVNAQGQPIQMLPQHQQVQLNAQGQPVRMYPQSRPVPVSAQGQMVRTYPQSAPVQVNAQGQPIQLPAGASATAQGYMHQQTQQYVFVESAQPGLYKRVPVTTRYQAQPQPVPQTALASPYAQSNARQNPAPAMTRAPGQPSPRVPAGEVAAVRTAQDQAPAIVGTASQRRSSQVNAASTGQTALPTVTSSSPNNSPAAASSSSGVKKSANSRLPILSNPLLTQRGAVQARDIAREQAKKKAAERRVVTPGNMMSAAQVASSVYHQAYAPVQSSAAVALQQAGKIAGQIPIGVRQAAGIVPNAQLNGVRMAQQPGQYMPAAQQQPSFVPQGQPRHLAYPPQLMQQKMYRPATQGTVLVRQPNGQLVMHALNPYTNTLSPAQMPVSMQQAPAMVYQNGVPMQLPGQPVYQYPVQGPPGAAVNPGNLPVPRLPITQLVPPPTAAVVSSAVSPAVSVAQVAADAIVANLIGAPQRSVRDRKLTGSLVKSANEVSTQPLVSASTNDLDLSINNRAETVLNTLPQIKPSFGAYSNEAQGITTVDMRGLGLERTAVLLNGRSFVPANGNGVVNLDAIPIPLIERIDVATGGNTTVYGSGAIAGAVNFVINERFQGAHFDVSHATPFDGEGASTRAALTFGTGFANDRGNVAVSVGASERQGVFRDQRNFSQFPQFEDVDSQGNPVLIDGGSTGVPGTSIFAGSLGGISPSSFGIIFDADGSLRPYDADGPAESNDNYNYNEANYLQIPQSAQQGMAVASFEITENHEVYGSALASSIDTVNQFAALPMFSANTDFTIDGSPFLAVSSQQILSSAFGNGIDSDGDGIDDTGRAFLRRRMLEVGPRRAEFESQTRFAQGGLRGKFGQLQYDVYLTKGEVEEDVSRTGAVSRDRFRQAMVLDLDASLDGQACLDPSSTGGSGACVPVNIFGPGNISADAVEFLRIDFNESATSTQSVRGASLSGELNILPAGPVRFTVGAERKSTAFRREVVSTEPLTDADDGLFNLNMSLDGQTSTDALYGEAQLPLLANLPGVRRLDAEVGYRLSDHSAVGQFASYRAAVSWLPTDFLSVRASYNEANRAPSIRELFLPQEERFTDAFDPCSAAGGAVSADVAAQCLALGVPQELIGSSFLNLPSGQLRDISGGNPDLSEESAETFTAGFSVDLPLTDNVQGAFGIDYFSMESSNAIGPVTTDAVTALQSCFDGTFTTTGQNNSYCNYVNRRADGSIESVNLFEQNTSSFLVEGFDFNAGLSTSVGDGFFALNYLGTQLDSAKFTAFDGAAPQDCDGQFGTLCGQPRPSYKHKLTATFQNDLLSAGLVWRRIGDLTDDDDNREFAVEEISARNYIDLLFNMGLTQSTDISVGVQNVGNTLPPVLSVNQSGANTYPQTFDTLGRTFFLRISGSPGSKNK